MTQETHDWIRKYFKVGFTSQRGNPWWHEEGDVHYADAVPLNVVEEVLDAAFAIEAPVYTAVNGTPFQVENRKAIILPGMENHVAFIPSDDYQIHQYKNVLLDKLRKHINGVGVASCGLTQKGNRAWVQLEAPQNENVAGFKFRPGLLAASSLDGSLATIVKRTAVAVVCDNTFAWALQDQGESVRVKHTRLSLKALEDNGTAMNAIKSLAESMGYAIESASRRVVTDLQFERFLELLVPLDTEEAKTGKRGTTLATNKRNDIANLYKHDERCAPWAGSVLGVMQAVNTYNTHVATVRNVDRIERNADNVISGRLDDLDAYALSALNKVLVAA